MSATWRNIHPDFKLNKKAYTSSSLEEFAQDLKEDTSSYKKAIGAFLSDWLDSKEAIEVKTSGSTGTPKTISLKKEYFVNSALMTGEYFDLGPGNKALLCLSAEYIAGKMMLVRAMVLGLQLDTVEPNTKPLDKTTESYDFTAMVPLQAFNSIQKLSQVKKLIIGGAPVSSDLKNSLRGLQTEIFETYGMTETVTHIAVKQLNPSPEINESVFFETLSGVKIQNDQRGCLVIDAPQITAQKVVTNDLVDIVDEKHFVWLGRYDNVINSGGVKLIPELIEAKLAKLLSRNFIVAGVPDEKLGQKLILIVEEKLDPEVFFKKLKQLRNLDRFEVPKKVYSVQKFQLTKNGKINREATLEVLRL